MDNNYDLLEAALDEAFKLADLYREPVALIQHTDKISIELLDRDNELRLMCVLFPSGRVHGYINQR